jgi:hypothetical protein
MVMSAGPRHNGGHRRTTPTFLHIKTRISESVLSRSFERYLISPGSGLVVRFKGALVRAFREVSVGLACLVASALPLSGQRAGGFGEDARVLGGGAWKLQILGDWYSFDQRYGFGTDGLSATLPRSLGSPLSFSPFGSSALSSIASVQPLIAQLADDPSFNASLGNLTLKAIAKIANRSLTIERGIGARIQVGVTVPFVTSSTTALFRAEPGSGGANISINPGYLNESILSADTLFALQVGAAGAALAERIVTCAGSTSPQCQAINADRAAAQQLVANATLYSSLLYAVYGSSFVPIAGSAPQLAIESRLAAMRETFGTYGVASFPAGAPTPATAPIGGAGVAALFTDPRFGIAADPFGARVVRGLGDIEVMAKLGSARALTTRGDSVALGNWRIRVAAAAGARLPTGKYTSPATLLGFGTGDRQLDLIGRAYVDLAFPGRLWASIIGSYTDQRPYTRAVRVPLPEMSAIIPTTHTMFVEADLGNVVQVDIIPRYDISPYLTIGAQYGFTRKTPDRFTGQLALDGLPSPLEASLLDEPSNSEEQRLSVGLTFTSGWERGLQTRWPIEASVVRYQTIAGRGGNQFKYFGSRAMLRWYLR